MTSQLPMVPTDSDLGPATVLPTQYFLKHILPPLHPDVTLDSVVTKLKTRGKKSQRAITKAGRWWGFPKDPEILLDDEANTVYKYFPRLVRAIAKWGAPKGVKPGLDILLNPEYDETPEDRRDLALPNAYMVPPETNANDVRWGDISVIGEYNKYRMAEQKNVRKLCWSIPQAFADPRRRSVFGYTIEDRRMRVWFCDKTQLLVSEFIDFMTEHKDVAQIFLSFLYAEPYQLGWDPSVKVAETESGLQYDYIVQNSDDSKSIFRTVELLSSSRRAAMLGSGTRVWKVLQVIDAAPVGEPMVLKDVWIHAELEREGSVLEKIQQSDGSSEFQESMSANFLTVVCHGDVSIHPRGGFSYCDRTLHHTGNAQAYLQAKPLPDPPTGISPSPPSIPFSEDNPLSGCRVHYRVVFNEVCRPLTLSSPLAVAFPALTQICGALKLMHTTGWLHRDVSIGNILIDESGHARLVDLEYAKRMGDDTIPEFRVGTTPFIASEVEAQTYICLEQSPTPSPLSYSQSDVDISLLYDLNAQKDAPRTSGSKSPSPDSPTPEALKTPSKSSPSPRYTVPQFHHNPLHDLESIFWIAAYFLFKTDGRGAEAAAIARQQKATRELFYDKLQRSSCIHDSTHFIRLVRNLHTSVQLAGFCLDAWRSELVSTFHFAEKDCSRITCTVADSLHDSLPRTLHRIANLMTESIHPQNRKRPLQDADGSHEERDVTSRLNKKPRVQVDSKK